MKRNLPVTGTENDFSADSHIVSSTDLKGITTAANADFIKFSGFAVLAGEVRTLASPAHEPHNI